MRDQIPPMREIRLSCNWKIRVDSPWSAIDTILHPLLASVGFKFFCMHRISYQHVTQEICFSIGWKGYMLDCYSKNCNIPSNTNAGYLADQGHSLVPSSIPRCYFFQLPICSYFSYPQTRKPHRIRAYSKRINIFQGPSALGNILRLSALILDKIERARDHGVRHSLLGARLWLGSPW